MKAKGLLKCSLTAIIVLIIISTYNRSYKSKYLTERRTDKQSSGSQPQWKKRIAEVCNLVEYGNMNEHILENEYNLKIDLNNFIVDDHRKLLFCVVPKAACTNIIKTMAVTQDLQYVSDQWKSDDEKLNTSQQRDRIKEKITKLPVMRSHNRRFYQSVGMDYLIYTPRHELFYKFKTYKKFMVVRNPYSRILSAFRDKLEKAYDVFYQRHYGVRIGKKYRETYSNKGDDITFNEFVKYITDTWSRGSKLERHWRSYYHLCHPCIIHYDLVVKAENLDEDSKLFFKWIGDNSTQSILSANYGPHTSSYKGDTLKKYYKSVDERLLPLLGYVYKIDFKLFDYDINSLPV